MLRDHPDIENIERTGYPRRYEFETKMCPVCGADVWHVYVNNMTGEVVGCEDCVDIVSVESREELK